MPDCPKEAPIHAPGYKAILLGLLIFGALIPQDIPEGHYNESLGLAHFPQTSGTIKGVVIDAQDRPIANASVSAPRHTDQPASRNDRTDIISDQEGRFVFSGVAPGTYTVFAFKEPQYPDSSFFGISEAYAKGARRTMTVEAGQTIDGVVLKLDPKHSLLKIFVKDEMGDGFGAGFTFTSKSSHHSFRTGGSVDGKSERWMPPNISFGLTVEAPGHQAQKFDIELKPDEPFELEVIMVQSDPKFGALEVYVTDGNGQPETGTLILMIKENEHSAKFGIPLNSSGFRRYFIPPDTPFCFEMNAGGRSIFHSRAVKGEEWIQLKSGEVMTVRYPFKAR